MRKHRHHKIPRSQGGGEEPENIEFLTPYDHAYHHAINFTEGGIEFDCRQEGWKLLPEWLREKVREEKSRRFREIRLGKGNSESNRAAVSRRHKGVPKPKSQRDKISKALKGKPKSEETRKKLSRAWENRRKTPVSEETKQKMRESHLKRWAELKFHNSDKNQTQ